MYGKIAKAPCGHDGETIIGNYVRCSKGCDKPGAVKPTAKQRSGVQGHANQCHCKECMVRIHATKIILRTVTGSIAATFDWDGQTEQINWVPPLNYKISGFDFLNEHDHIIAWGSIKDGFGDPVEAVGGWKMLLRTKNLISAIV